MGNILVDTHLVVAYYKEDNLGLLPEEINVSSSVVDFFSKITAQKDIIFVDHAGVDNNGKELDGKIVSEWKRNVPNDAKHWFETWYATLLLSGQIKYIAMDKNCHELLQVLHERYDFPRDGWDKWYVRTAKSVANHEKKGDIVVIIVTEDLDFYDPNQKGVLRGEARIKFMEQQSGPIPPVLAKEGIAVKCISIY